MALNKKIELTSGIVTNYHRIASMNIITNQQNIIEVDSYTSKEKREVEKTALEQSQEKRETVPFNVFIDATYITCPYNQTMTIKSAYDYLKTLPEYEGAKDI